METLQNWGSTIKNTPLGGSELPLLGVLILLAIVVYHIYKAYRAEISYTESSLDGQRYLVRNLEDKEKAADLLSQLKTRLKTLVRHLAGKYPNEERIKRLIRNFQRTIFAERTRTHIYTSYTVDKGVKMIYCLRQKNGDIVDLNTLMYVGLHELGHVMTKTLDHSDEFWENFEFILAEAIELGIWNYHDFGKNPVEYCGQMIRQTPQIGSTAND